MLGQDHKTKRWSIKATIVKARNKRSFIVNDGNREFIRNRRFLRPRSNTETKVCSGVKVCSGINRTFKYKSTFLIALLTGGGDPHQA